jgi:predicted dehydrogenase
MFRYNEGFDLVRRAATEGWLGRIHYVHANMSSSIPPGTREKLALHPGGMMFELACHLIDMLILLLGSPARISPFLRHDADADDALADNTAAVFEFEHALAVIESAGMEVGPFPRRQFEVCGSRGSIVLQPLEPPSLRLCLDEARAGFQAGWQGVSVSHTPRYVRDMDELARSIRGEQEFPYTKGHDLAVQEAVLRACGDSGEA